MEFFPSVKRSLKTKLFIITLLPLVLLAVIICVATINNKINTEQNLLNDRISTYVVFLESGELSFESIENQAQLEELFKERVLHAVIFSREEEPLYQTETDGTFIDTEMNLHVQGVRRALEGYALSQQFFDQGENTLSVYRPIVINNRIVGVFHVQLLYEESTQRIRQYELFVIVLSLISIVVPYLLFNFLTQRLISRRIEKLRAGTGEVTQGNLSHKIEDPSEDELGVLANSFNAMTEIIERSQKQLEEYNIRLELQVKDRTVQLNRKIDELEETKRSLEEAKVVVEELNKNLEEKVSERTDELQKANVEIQQLLETRTRFVNQVAHDLRTPLTPIKILLPQLKKRLLEHVSEEEEKQLGMIEDNLQYLSHLVDDTLSIARLDAGSTELSVKKLDLAALIDDVVKNQQAVFDEQGVKVAVEMDRPLPVPIDELRIKEVLSNLISNSLKFMHMEEKRIDIHAASGEDKVIVSFADNGDGVEKHHLEEIFQEFNKIDPARHTHSSGLGLAICRRIIEKHGGKIWAESEGLGKGLTVKFTLPTDKATAANSSDKQEGKP